jgi:predicted nucleotidyltransferase
MFSRELISSFLRVFGDKIVSLVLYGSYARRDFSESSDIDLLVVLEEVGDRYLIYKEIDVAENIPEPVYKCFKKYGYYPHISHIILSRDRAKYPRPLYLDLVSDHKILYDKDLYVKSLGERKTHILHNR